MTAAGPWTAQKWLRKGGKQLAWISIGLWTGFTFVGYVTPIRTLAAEAFTLGFDPWEWFWVLFYGRRQLSCPPGQGNCRQPVLRFRDLLQCRLHA